jgi:hypothetical protein
MLYSPKCVEGEFCEVELPIYGVLGSSHVGTEKNHTQKSPFWGCAIAGGGVCCNRYTRRGARKTRLGTWERGIHLATSGHVASICK